MSEYAKIQGIRQMMDQQRLQQSELQTQQLQQTGLQQENQKRALDLQDIQTLRSLGPKYVTKDDSGNVTGFNFNGLASEATGKGVNPATVQALQLQHANTVKALAESTDAVRNAEISKNKQAYETLEGIRGITDPAQRAAAYPGALQNLRKLGIDTREFPQQYPGDDALNSFEAGLGMHAQILDDAKKTADINKAKADSFKEVPGTGMFFNPLTNETKTTQGSVLTPAMMESKYVEIQKAQKLNQPISADDKAFVQGYEKMKTLVPQFNLNMQGNLLKGGALDLPAEMYWQTGTLPAGMRSPAMSAAIINRATELHPNSSTELAGNKAAYEANKKSYDNVTGTLDTLSAFEQSGLKNLKQFTDLASKLPDTGVPWLNTPVRKLNQNLVGAEYMPAIEAARGVALREIARVTNDPKLSGSLTDSARGEVSSFSPENATLPQIKHVVETLTNDMANVHSSLAAQKADIGNRLGIKAKQESQPQAASQQSSGHKVGDIITQNGKNFKATAVDASGKVTAADPQ